MLLKDKPILFVDCETTGLDDEYHEIISVALVRRHDGKTWTFKAKPNWPDHIDPRAVAVNGYTPSAWMDAMSQEELANKLGILMKDYIIVGHNPRFDVGFIKNLLWRHKIKHGLTPAPSTPPPWLISILFLLDWIPYPWIPSGASWGGRYIPPTPRFKIPKMWNVSIILWFIPSAACL